MEHYIFGPDNQALPHQELLLPKDGCGTFPISITQN